MKNTKKRPVMPTMEEDAFIKIGIASDPDTYELSEEEFARMRPASELFPDLVKAYKPSSAKIKTKPFDISHRLATKDEIRVFLQIMLEENGIEGLIRGINFVVKAKGMSEVARITGMSRESLDRV